MAGSYGSPIFRTVLRTSTLISVVASLLHIAANSVGGSLFPSPTSSPAFGVCFIDGHCSDWGEVDSQCHFDFHFRLT
jgi:hypothetical protein